MIDPVNNSETSTPHAVDMDIMNMADTAGGKTTFYNNCGNDKTISIIAGPCVFENEDHAVMMAESLREICAEIGDQYGTAINFLYKTSFDKANRTSVDSFRGVSFDEAHYGMQAVRELGIEVITDVHDPWQCDAVCADIIQIPAFLCRQTDLLKAAVETGKPVNIKKGQFLSPREMEQVVLKLEHFGARQIMITERGTTFGYNDLVVDMRSLEIMQAFPQAYPVIMDCTHAVQSPGGMGAKSGGNREMAKVIARSATAVGIAGLFMEVHDNPEIAPSDGPNMIRLRDVYGLLRNIVELDIIAKNFRKINRNVT